MIKYFKKIVKSFKYSNELREENEKLKQALLKLDPAFKVIPFFNVIDVQKWKTSTNEILPVEMGYFHYSVKVLQSVIANHINKEALYITLRKITSEQMNEIEARNFIYALFLILEKADEISSLEVQFQKTIANKNMEAMRKYNVLR